MAGTELYQGDDYLTLLAETVRSVNDNLQTTPSVLSKEWILKEYGNVFEGLGCIDGLRHMEVDKTLRLVVHPPRKVSVALRDCLKEELHKLVIEGIITPVTEPTKWVPSLVVMNKPEKLSICIDPKDLNKALLRSHYPLSKAKVFSVLDAKNRFWQVELDTDSLNLTTFNTPFGIFRWRCLPFGVKTASRKYQHRIHESLQNLDGIKDILNDIHVLCMGDGDTYESAVQHHDGKLIALLGRCREKKIKLNPKKLQLSKQEALYIGLPTPDGLKPDPNKGKAIVKMPTPGL